jgi:SAM-dependent methyltransferase
MPDGQGGLVMATVPAVLQSERVSQLAEQWIDFSEVECLPEEVRRYIGDPRLFSLAGVLAYTTGHSKIAEILHQNPASDAMLRIVYPDTNGHPLTEGLDKFLSRSLSGQALRDRLDFCSQWLADYFVKSGKLVVDLGGGSGSYAFEALRRSGQSPPRFRWDILDLDLEAVVVAQLVARGAGLESAVTARHGNFMKDVGPPADYAVMIGVLCGMDKATAVAVLKRAKAHLKPGGELLAATLLMRAFREDPRTFRILCNVGGWQLRPKEPAEVQQIFEDAGWQILSTMSERPGGDGQYAIVHARC